MTSEGADTPRSGQPPAEVAWHTLGADQVLHSEEVDGQHGLSSAEAAARAQRFGPNKLAEGRAEPRWRAFVRQYRDPMQLVLLAAGIGSLYPLKQLGTGILLVLLTLFNAVEGLHQEGKAASAVAALQKTMIIKARVRRDGVSEAYRLPVANGELLAIEHALRRREAEWARRRLVAEQLHRAKEAVQRQTKNWGLTGMPLPAGCSS